MPRPARKTRERRTLSDLEREYLICGYWTGGRGLEPSIKELAALWREHCSEILDLEGNEDFGFALGCAPWAFWICDCGLGNFPKSQAVELEKLGYISLGEKTQIIAAAREKLGYISLGEKTQIIAAAREQLRAQTRPWSETARAAVEGISDSELFAAWPHIPNRVWDFPKERTEQYAATSAPHTRTN